MNDDEFDTDDETGDERQSRNENGRRTSDERGETKGKRRERSDGRQAESEEGAEVSGRERFGRRGYLKMAGTSTVAAAGFSLASDRVAAGTNRHGIWFDRVLDAVDDLGMDPSGDDPIDGDLDFRDGTLIEFPPGTYRVQNKQYENGLNRWGIRGTGGNRSEVRFVPPDGNTQRIFQINGYGFRDDCSDVLVENVTFDQSATTGTAASNQFYVSDGLEIHDVETYGYNPTRGEANQPNGREINGLYLMVYDAGGTGVIENYKYVGETTVVDYPKNATGIATYRDHAGTLYVRDCNIENRGEHAIYASRCSGDIRVEGGTFKNCANTNMRISGSGSYVEDATIGIDRDRSYFVEADTGEEKSGRGMWWEAGDVGKTGGHIENCDFVLDADLNTPGLIRVEGTTGAIEIRDTRIQNNSSENTRTVFVNDLGDGPGNGWPPTPHDVEMTNCSFTGTSPSPAVESQRSGAPVTVSNSCESMPNGGDFEGALSTSDISHSNCPVPNGGNGGGGDDGDDGSDRSNRITIKGTGPGRTNYSFNVDGDLEAAVPSHGEEEADATDNSIGSSVGDGNKDAFWFSGDIGYFNFSNGDLRVWVNGHEIENPDTHWDDSGGGGGGDGGPENFPNTITIEGIPGNGTVEYTVSGTGEFEGEFYGQGPQSGQVTGGVAEGGTDVIHYSGKLTDFTAAVQVRIFLNGMEVSQGTVGGSNGDALPKTIRIEGLEGNGKVDYTISGTGEFKGEVYGRGRQSGQVTGRVAEGGSDVVEYSGELTDFTAAVQVRTIVNGYVVSQGTIG